LLEDRAQEIPDIARLLADAIVLNTRDKVFASMSLDSAST